MEKISQETVMKDRSKWVITLSIDNAKRASKDFNHSIYKMPNGAYAVRKPTGKRLTPEIRRKLKASGQ